MRWLYLLSVFLLSTARLAADGGFKSHVMKPVAIPQQVAALSHKEGKQTLTIWNTVESAEKDLAWVLPLPAVPDTIQSKMTFSQSEFTLILYYEKSVQL